MISQNKQKGFTIVELLIVIVVIGILAAISIVAYNGVTQKARDDQRLADARNIVNAAASYQAERGNWPTKDEVVTYDTIKLTGNAADAGNLGTVPDADNKNRYGYEICTDGSPAVNSGVKVTYYIEATKEAKPLTTGKCS